MSWPQHFDVMLIVISVNLAASGLIVLGMRHGSRMASLRSFTVLLGLGNLIIVCGFYIMYGVARPWEDAIQRWVEHQTQPSSRFLAAAQATAAPTLETARHLFLLGTFVFIVGLVWLPATYAIWNYRRARADDLSPVG